MDWKSINGYLTYVIPVMIVFGVVLPFLFELHYDAKLNVSPFVGASMQDTIPSGNMILWMKYHHPPGALRPGQIGCFNSSIAATAYNRSEYVVCHWLNGTEDLGGTLNYVFHSDAVCEKTQKTGYMGYLETLTTCNIQSDYVLPSDVKGRVLFWFPPLGLLSILAGALYAGYWFYKKRKKKDDEEPLRGMQVIPNLQSASP